MKRFFLPAIAILLATASMPRISAQEYVAPKVTISKEKVRAGGKVFYSHVVQERQTIYSISKAYGVTMEEIYDANPALKLETEGLKKDQILLVPYKGDIHETEARPETAAEAETTIAEAIQENERTDDGEYFIHRVKWYEDLDAIARKYKVSKESVKNINKMTSDKVRRKQELKIPRDPAAWEGRAVTGEPVVNNEPEVVGQEEIETDIPDEVENDENRGAFDDLFVREGRHHVDITMLLPFSTTKSGDRISFMDFYCGVLLASRVLGSEGVNIDIHTFDVGGGNMPVTGQRLASTDFAIGPVSKNDIMKAAGINDEATWIVSPLDMQVESLTDSLKRIIQAPTPTHIQVKDMVDWIKSDMGHGDRVIVVTPSTPESGYLDMVESEMDKAGLPHVTSTLGSMHSQMVTGGVNRIVLACEYTERSTVFLIEALRNLYMFSSKNSEIVLYSTSKIRTYDQIEVEQFHKVNLHASVTYSVDYESKEVKDFLLQYRALYNTEPSRSAYSGYDLMKYFATLSHKYGKKWPKALDRVDHKGLQSDFKLVRTHSGSYVNNAVRRVVYNPDYSVSLVR
ncbi:MAG: LysM peptidoglycan-binding domain-containing protein [Bacteroidales bacterium]|nr:LysM peptidoglycan-binding domain-containing protein [Bacteroidales bacterium]